MCAHGKHFLLTSLSLLAVAALCPGCPIETGPKAAFRAEPDSGAAPLTVQFTDLSLPGSSPISSWHWEFGDGQSSDQPDPSHQYAMPGIFEAILTVTTSVGCDTSLPAIIIVEGGEGEASPWQNPANPLDVNDDGVVSPLDSLLVINDLNTNGARALPNPPVSPPPPPPYLDTNGDGWVSSADVSLIVNYLNTHGT